MTPSMTVASLNNEAKYLLGEFVCRTLGPAERPWRVRTSLGFLADEISQLPGICAAAIATNRREHSNIEARGFEESQIDFILNLLKMQHDSGNAYNEWIPIGGDGAPHLQLFMRSLRDGFAVSGTAIVGLECGDDNSQQSLEILEWLEPHIVSVINASCDHEEMVCTRALEQLISEELGKQQPEPSHIVSSILDIFGADEVAMFGREQGELYLYASTSERLNSFHAACDDLSIQVLENGIAVRRNDINCSDCFPKSNGFAEALSIHDDKNSTCQGGVRFLSVPMHSHDDIKGAIRIVRSSDKPRFEAYEEDRLVNFSRILGRLVEDSWKLFLSMSIMEAKTETIFFTRHDSSKKPGGTGIPRIVYADACLEKICGVALSELKNTDARNLYDHGEYEKVVKSINEAMRRGLKACGPLKINIRTSRGTVKTGLASYRIITSPFACPEVYYTINSIRDITTAQRWAGQHKRTAQRWADQHKRLMGLLAEKHIAYFRSDVMGRTLESSDAECALTQYSKSELVGMNREKLYADPNQRGTYLEEMESRGGRLVHVRQHLKRKDGTPFWIEGSMCLIKDANGRPAGTEGLYEDITDRMRLQGVWDVGDGDMMIDKKLQARFEENEKFHLNFLAGLSHQLRTPLGALVQTLLNYKRGIVDGEKMVRRLDYVIGQANVCSLLVAHLTYMDKVLRNEDFEVGPVRLAMLAVETKIDFEHLTKERGLDVAVDDSSLDRCLGEVRGHRELLRQVVVVLVDNAIKYSNDGSSIRIKGHEEIGGPFFEISNVGLRISRNDSDRIFNRGFRSEAAKALVPHGTGLGLWLAKKILDTHGATIRCSSETDGDESRIVFKIRFPKNDVFKSGKMSGLSSKLGGFQRGEE